MLQLKALAVAEDKGIPTNIFSVSYRWSRRFMCRHKLSIRARTRHGQTTPEVAQEARSKFFLLFELSASLFLNVVAEFFEYLPRMTVITSGEKAVLAKGSDNDNERASAMLLAA
ncbi:hypothetical protein PHMEG_00021637 [Phytophthora megakarya]|uniref:HTH CENPB-type domain-containing protein n=1 Tax=Phytophthora megakarya TaxID=4795 RepID=A0A225VKQ3_9STRA|nr:hypothetical protein PHMEG_00021637 [Phytophthora megakarya]